MPLRTFALLAFGLVFPLHAQFRAGIAIRDITPDLAKGPVYLAGFDNGRVATAVEHPLTTRCLAFAGAKSKPVVLCGVDSIGLFLDDVRRVRAQVPNAHVIVAATHVHEAPDTMGLWGPKPGVSGIDEDYNTLVVNRTAEAANAALKSLQPAVVRPAGISYNWRRYFNDSRPPVVLDDQLLVLTLETLKGRRIAALVNWASHPEALGSRNTRITPDWPHYLYDEIQTRTSAPAVFINGALGGMMSPLGAKFNDPETGKPAEPETFRFAEIVGRDIAQAATDPANFAFGRPLTPDVVEYKETEVDVPVSNANFLAASAAGVFKGRRPINGGKASPTVVGLLRLSGKGRPILEAACIPGEIYPELSKGFIAHDPNADYPDAPSEPAIKGEILPFGSPMVFGLCNDELGYIIPKAQWDEKPPFTFGAKKAWYGEVNSPDPDTARVLLNALKSLAR